MEITDIRIRKLNLSGENSRRMRALVSITFDDEFVVHDIKVIKNNNKCFIAMPSRQIEDGSYKDIAHPIRAHLRSKIQEAVLAKYESALAMSAENAAVVAASSENKESNKEFV